MSAKKAPAKQKSSKKGKAAEQKAVMPEEVAHRLYLLLHSIHQIERYEEKLCSLQDAIKRTGRVGAPVLRDLQTLIEELPSDEFLHDLDALRTAVQP